MTNQRSTLPSWWFTPDAISPASAPDTEMTRTSTRARLLSLLLRPKSPPLALGLVVAATLIVAETVLVILLKHVAPMERLSAVYLFGVFVVSSIWSLKLGVLTSIVSVFVSDLVRSWPTDQLVHDELHNGVAHLSLLIVALMASVVAGLARARAGEADRRRYEAEFAYRLVAVGHDTIEDLAEQQAALRRVATLVARGVTASEVFSAVVEEMTGCLHVSGAILLRYQPDGEAVVTAAYGGVGSNDLSVGSRISLERGNLDADAQDSVALSLRGFGLLSGVGAPIVVDGQVWGAVIADPSHPEFLPTDAEARAGDFAELAATAITNAATREELKASRARIVAAADDARRRLERDLHDGAQQRIESLKLETRLAEASVPPELNELRRQISDIVAGLNDVSDDLHEFSRGIHPAILSSGLGAALATLARRSAVPVTLDISSVAERGLSESVEVAVYYIVAEALTNTAKYAQASEAHASVHVKDQNLCLCIGDDGIGGANPRNGSGLVGLTDRVEALGGRMQIVSPPGTGTSLHVTIPLAGK
jgi:signal transduction histidine kinase